MVTNSKDGRKRKDVNDTGMMMIEEFGDRSRNREASIY